MNNLPEIIIAKIQRAARQFFLDALERTSYPEMAADKPPALKEWMDILADYNIELPTADSDREYDRQWREACQVADKMYRKIWVEFCKGMSIINNALVLNRSILIMDSM